MIRAMNVQCITKSAAGNKMKHLLLNNHSDLLLLTQVYLQDEQKEKAMYVK
jgi:hypothetical protein